MRSLPLTLRRRCVMIKLPEMLFQQSCQSSHATATAADTEQQRRTAEEACKIMQSQDFLHTVQSYRKTNGIAPHP